jgi:hypothetical protein
MRIFAMPYISSSNLGMIEHNFLHDYHQSFLIHTSHTCKTSKTVNHSIYIHLHILSQEFYLIFIDITKNRDQGFWLHSLHANIERIYEKLI